MVHILHLNLNKYHNPLENCLSAIINRAHIELSGGPALNYRAEPGMSGLSFGRLHSSQANAGVPRRSARPISSHPGRRRGIQRRQEV